MGVCGYTWDEVQNMPINALARAISARNKRDNLMLRSVGRFLGVEFNDAAPKPSARPFSLKLFDAWFGGARG